MLLGTHTLFRETHPILKERVTICMVGNFTFENCGEPKVKG